MRNRVPLAGMLPEHGEYNIGDLVYAKISRAGVTEYLALIIEESMPGIFIVQPVKDPNVRRNVTIAQIRKASKDE